MEIRGQRTWCERCQAPRLGPDEQPAAELFMAAMPEYRINGGMGATHAQEGFSRPGVLALMQLRGIPDSERAALWSDLETLEDEYRRIRHLKQQAAQTHKTPSLPKPS